jgi:hypothetical protein
MRRPINFVHNTKFQEVIQPETSLDRGVHFPDIEVLEKNLSGEIGLCANKQSVHWFVVFARLLNRYPILALQFRQLSAVSDKKTELAEMTSRLPSASFQEFLINNQQEEKIKDVPDVIWTH